MKEEDDLVVSVRGGEGGPLYSANRSVPAPNKYGNIVHRLGVDRIKFRAKDEAGWRQKGFGRPTTEVVQAHLWREDRSYPLEGGYQHSRPYLTRELTY